MGAPVVLEGRGIDFSYGALQVLFGVDLEVRAGARVALLGTNGAGKSTLLRVLAGLTTPQRGVVLLDGQDVTAIPAEERTRLGIGMVEGGRAIFPSLSVAENLRLGGYTRKARDPQVEARLGRVLDLFPALAPRRRQAAGTLSGGEQQMVAIGRALVADPRVLMIDELSLGLAPVIMEQIVQAVEQLAADGTTLVLVEQSLNVAVSLTESAYFMEKGEIRYSGPPSELLERGDLVRSVFFGRR